MEYFIKKIFYSNKLADDQKIDLIVKIMHASMGSTIHIAPNLFLRVIGNGYNSHKYLQLWQRTVKEDGSAIVSNTGYTIDKIIDIYLKYLPLLENKTDCVKHK